MMEQASKRGRDTIMNLCPHDVNVYHGDDMIHFPTRGANKALRLEEKAGVETMNEDGIPESTPSEYVGLNYTPEPGSRIIVSQLVASYLRDHQGEYNLGNVYAPDTGPNGGKRNEGGQIIGTKRLIKYI
jgi:hypothetical protein